MRSKIVRAKISFNFDNATNQLRARKAMNEEFPEQFARDDNRIAIIENTWKLLHGESDWQIQLNQCKSKQNQTTTKAQHPPLAGCVRATTHNPCRLTVH